MNNLPKNRLHKLALESAQTAWGDGWSKLTDDMREAYLAREVLLLLLGQCEASGKYEAAKELVLAAMSWKEK